MNRDEYLHLLGERTALERMIADTPEHDVIDRASLSARLKTVEDAIARDVERAFDLGEPH